MTELFFRQQCRAPDCAPFVEIRTTFHSTLPYAGHFHPDFSLGLVLEGRTLLALGNRHYVAEKGDIVLIAHGLAHSCNPLDGRPRSYHMAFIDDGWFQAHVPALLGMRQAGVRVPVVRQSPLFAGALALLAEVLDGCPDARSRVGELFCELQKAHKCFGPESDGHAGEALRYLESLSAGGLADERRAVAELAAAAGVGRESFSRSFRRVSGLSPSCYLHCLRLENGRRLLRKGKSVAEAAAASGYADQSHFHRMFVKFFSITPGLCKRRSSHSYKK